MKICTLTACHKQDDGKNFKMAVLIASSEKMKVMSKIEKITKTYVSFKYQYQKELLHSVLRFRKLIEKGLP